MSVLTYATVDWEFCWIFQDIIAHVPMSGDLFTTVKLLSLSMCLRNVPWIFADYPLWP